MTTLAGLTNDNVLALFDSQDPSQVSFVPVTGVEGTLLGIDVRPANGVMYGISTSNNLYTIDPVSGAASLASTLSEPFLAGAVSGFDFNPVADRLRLVGDNDQDFRINVDTGSVTIDGDLAFAAGDTNTTADANVTAVAYTNSFAGTTSTQLYDIDGQLDILALQNPPNDGILQTIGSLNTDFAAIAGFDIISDPSGTNIPFAVSNSTLYSIDLATGAATSLGAIGNSDLSLTGLTAAPAVALPQLSIETQFFALSDDNTLLSFSPLDPSSVTSMPLTGLDGTLLGIDVRPATGQLYGVTNANRLYTIDPNSTPGNGNFSGAFTLTEEEEGFLRDSAIYLNLHTTRFNGGELRGQVNVTPENDIVEPSIALEESQQVGETVPPADGSGMGEFAVVYDDATNTLDISGNYNNLTGSLLFVGETDSEGNPQSPIHIHSGVAGANGPIVRNLTIVGDNRFEGRFTLTDEEEAQLFADALYVNLHTTSFNSGELRGQIDVTLENDIVAFDISLEESQQVGTVPPDTAATSTFDLAYDNRTNALTTDGQFSSLTGSLFPVGGADAAGNPESAVHLHRGVAGSNGPIVRNLTAIETNTTLVSTLSTPFDAGAVSGIDFNPVADRLRLVGDTDTDFRINVDTGAVIVDGDLAFAAGDAGEGIDPSVSASAYTNSFAGTTSTQLYNIDTQLDRLVLQNPPNDGILQTVGDLGVDFDTVAGFDIVTQQGRNLGYAVSNSRLYGVDLVTGQAFNLGAIGNGGNSNLRGFAVAPGDGQFDGRLDRGGSGEFDPAQYLASHPDLITAFGFDLDAAADHFEEFGQAENRTIDSFDELRYLASFGDLIATFGLDLEDATEHFIRHGFTEGRSDDDFNPVGYLDNFVDLRRAFGSDFVAAAGHFVTNGFAEGRTDS